MYIQVDMNRDKALSETQRVIINTSSLSGSISFKGAAIDVYSEEPAKKNILFGVQNLILTPHIAASTEEAQLVVAQQIAEQISEFFKTGKITNSV